ncbi:MAG TPA: hypothetical protein VHL34_24985 [Rhizomicrobium sp.]|nr:hypothetical protein [Rhizomicrobium sp.]
MSAGQFCGVCRHWQDAERSADETLGWGWCRRYPPRVSDHVASMVIERPKFGGRNYDPEDVVTVSAVSDASIFPATWHDEFCGEFAAVADPVNDSCQHVGRGL